MGKSVAGGRLERTNCWIMSVTVEDSLVSCRFKASPILLISSSMTLNPQNVTKAQWCTTSESGGIHSGYLASESDTLVPISDLPEEVHVQYTLPEKVRAEEREGVPAEEPTGTESSIEGGTEASVN